MESKISASSILSSTRLLDQAQDISRGDVTVMLSYTPKFTTGFHHSRTSDSLPHAGKKDLRPRFRRSIACHPIADSYLT